MTAPPEATPRDVEIATIVRDARKLATEIEDLESELRKLELRLLELVPIGARITIDDKQTRTIAPSRRFDLTLACSVAESHGIPMREISVVDASDLKARLRAARLIDRAMAPGAGPGRVAW